MRTCEVENCSNKHLANGFCQKHYLRRYRHNSLEVKFPRGLPVVDRIKSKIKIDEYGCWILQAYINKKGYGHLRDDTGKMRFAHVVMYEEKYGGVPEGKELDHTCRNRACANPDHVEPVPHAINVRRGNAGINWKDLPRNPETGQFLSQTGG